MESGFLLDVVVRKSSAIFQLFSSEDQSLLIWWDSLLILDLCLDVFNRVRGLNLKGDCLSSEGFNKDLHTTSKSQNQVKGRLFLDVVVRKSSSILQLLTSEDQSLLVWGDSLLVLDLGLDILNGVTWLNLQGDGLASQGLHEDLHTPSQSQHQMQSRLLLDVIVRKSSSIFKLLPSKDQSLLVWRNSFLVLDFSFDIFDGIGWLDLKSDGLTSKSLDENLHSTPKSQDQVKGRLLLDVIVRKSPSILKLLSGEDQSLLVWWDSLLILDLSLDVLNGIGWLNLQGDSLTSQGLNEDLHTSSQSEDQVKSGLFLDIVVRQSPPILKLFTGKDQSLLIWGNSLLVLNLSLDILNGIGW